VADAKLTPPLAHYDVAVTRSHGVKSKPESVSGIFLPRDGIFTILSERT
jgi:hypothetical protein